VRVGAGVLIVDTVSQFAGLRGDAENNSGDALAAVEPLQAAAAEGTPSSPADTNGKAAVK
jgi:hypothetical protein